MSGGRTPSQVALLTAGRDKPYALGLAASLVDQGVPIDFIGSDDVQFHAKDESRVRSLNLRGDQSEQAPAATKVLRVLVYYLRLLIYAATARPRLFHILWNNKFEWFDRTVLMGYYRLLGKRIVLTAHNVNAGSRDGTDSALNRLTLRIQYRLAHHVFVHTQRMRRELISDYGLNERKVTVIPFGVNSTVPDTDLTPAAARARLGLGQDEKVMLFFGNIAPYKGLEYLVDAMPTLLRSDARIKLVIAGRVKGGQSHWQRIREAIDRLHPADRVLVRAEFVPDEETEVYFKAADVLVLPYTHIFQSGVLFLAYNFGLPVLASDVGALREDVVEGRTGLVFRPRDPADLARCLRAYFSSDLYQRLDEHRAGIREFAHEHYSWARVGSVTTAVYADLLIAGDALPKSA